MDKSKLLNLFIIAFAVSLLVQLYFAPQKDTQTAAANILLQVKDDSITMPNIPIIEVKNQTQDTIEILPCTDISLSIDTRGKINNIAELAPSFCTALSIPAGATKKLPMDSLYRMFSSQAGKYIVTLNTSSYGEKIVYFETGKPGIFRTFISQLVYQPIYNLFVALLTFLPGHPLGWAIIIVTIIIRLILLVPQHHMLEGQKKLQKIQPKIKALQKEYKNDQATLGMKMLEMYKTEKVNPMGSLLPLFIQMPILIGLYWVISQINEPSNFYHLYSFFGNFDPTAIVTNFYGIELSHIGGTMGILLAVILAGLQYLQARLSFAYTEKKAPPEKKTEIEKKDGDAPELALDPAMMQKMMLYFFPLMIAVSSFFFPLGVGLYWFVGTLFVIAQQAYVNRKHA